MSGVVIIEKELSYLIMQAAFEDHKTLGAGFPVAQFAPFVLIKESHEN